MFKKHSKIKNDFFENNKFQNVFKININKNVVSQNIMFVFKQSKSSKTSIKNNRKNNKNKKNNKSKNTNENFSLTHKLIFFSTF